jgi:predicted transcriptional regulator
MQDTEWDIMSALWDAGSATAREVTEALAARRGWKYSTVKTMLDRMVDKHMVEAERVGNVWSYSPAMPRVDAQRTAWQRFVDTVFDGSMKPALQFIATDAKLTKRQREQLLALLDEDRRELGGRDDA